MKRLIIFAIALHSLNALSSAYYRPERREPQQIPYGNGQHCSQSSQQFTTPIPVHVVNSQGPGQTPICFIQMPTGDNHHSQPKETIEQEVRRRTEQATLENTIKDLRTQLKVGQAELQQIKKEFDAERYGWSRTFRHWGYFGIGAIIASLYWTYDPK